MWVTNDADGRTLKRHGDDLKLLPLDIQIQDDLANVETMTVIPATIGTDMI